MLKKVHVTKLNQFSGHKDCIYAIIKADNDKTFYSGAADGFVVKWNVNDASNGILICKVNRPIYSLLLLPTKNQLLIGTAEGNLHVIDLNQNQEIKNIAAHTLGLFDIKLINNHIFTAGGDGCVQVFDMNFNLIKSFKDSDKSARCIAINHQLNHLAIGYSDHKIRIYDTESLQLIHTLDYHINSVFALSYCNQNKHLLSGGRDVFLKFYDAENNYQVIKDVPAHNLHINSIQFNDSGTLFVTSSMDKMIKVWDAQTFDLIKVIDKARNESHINSVNKAVWLTNNEIISVSDDKQIMHWRIDE